MVQIYFATLKQQGAQFTAWIPDLDITVRGQKYEIFTKTLNALRAYALSGAIPPPSDFVTLEGRPDVRGQLVDGGNLITVPLGDEISQQNVTKKDWTRDILNAGSRAYRLTPAERNDIELVLKEKDAVVERLGLKRDRLFDEAELQRLLAECPITQTTPYPRIFHRGVAAFYWLQLTAQPGAVGDLPAKKAGGPAASGPQHHQRRQHQHQYQRHEGLLRHRKSPQEVGRPYRQLP